MTTNRQNSNYYYIPSLFLVKQIHLHQTHKKNKQKHNPQSISEWGQSFIVWDAESQSQETEHVEGNMEIIKQNM